MKYLIMLMVYMFTITTITQAATSPKELDGYNKLKWGADGWEGSIKSKYFTFYNEEFYKAIIHYDPIKCDDKDFRQAIINKLIIDFGNKYEKVTESATSEESIVSYNCKINIKSFRNWVWHV